MLSWNFTNWATVGVMALIWFGLIGVGMKLWQKRQANQGA